ncbi:MAG TPA: DUF362 domain-containing protein, partial [Candidatus Deferrimicrobium sp.]|nr:DUF362 domain-containing protein [Candidatus Deferrimicrobium sp.]
MTQVAIINTTEFLTLFDSINHCLELLGTQKIKNAKNILLKPNCLLDKPDAATSPKVIRGVIEVIQKIKTGQDYILSIGDSPGLLSKNPRIIFENLGIMDIIEATGIEYIQFDGGAPPILVQIPDGTRLKETMIAPIVESADLIINLPKLKTHMLTLYTGAIKNYWGVQPGGNKPKNHLKGTSTETFSQVITDLFSYLADKPQLVIMDALQGMEGNGPSSGKMRTMNLILGGYDPVAVDTIALTIVGHTLEDAPHVKMCAERNLGIGDLPNIEILGKPLTDATLFKPFRFPGK